MVLSEPAWPSGIISTTSCINTRERFPAIRHWRAVVGRAPHTDPLGSETGPPGVARPGPALRDEAGDEAGVMSANIRLPVGLRLRRAPRSPSLAEHARQSGALRPLGAARTSRPTLASRALRATRSTTRPLPRPAGTESLDSAPRPQARPQAYPARRAPRCKKTGASCTNINHIERRGIYLETWAFAAFPVKGCGARAARAETGAGALRTAARRRAARDGPT